MPKGVYPHTHIKPKVYPKALVDQIRSRYEAGATQVEIGAELGLTQRVIWRVMLNHAIPRRKRVKRNQRGEKNASWKGNNAGYQAFHCRLYALRGKPRKCERCGTETQSRTYDWANLTGKYDDPSDYQRMCRQCHRQYDNQRRKATKGR